VYCSNEMPLISGWNCFGFSEVETGQSRLPKPAARITVFIG
jgi:hypothetical protein